MSTLFHGLNHSANKLLDIASEFITKESLSGILMFMAAFVAILLANSPVSQYYFDFWHTPVSLSVGDRAFSLDLLVIVNDGLMSVFFLMVGLEIKRELLLGELTGLQKAAFPVAGAMGGMLVPALIFFGFNMGTEYSSGFGIPMATDIAFTMGILMLLGKRVPFVAKIFVLSLAIVDDMGAIIIIALFYSDTLHWMYLFYGSLTVLAMVILNMRKVKSLRPYMFLGIILWYCVHESGIHATIAGVIISLCIPVVSKINKVDFLRELQHGLDFFCGKESCDTQAILLTPFQRNMLETMHKAYVDVQNPLVRLERLLHSWTAFIIMPLFAFANAGIHFGHFDMGTSLFWGIFFGLFVGKPIGIYAFTYSGVKLGLLKKPDNLTWRNIFGLGLLAGVGFTMSIFIAHLAFADEAVVESAKSAILFASLCAGVLGAVYMIFFRHVYYHPRSHHQTEHDGGQEHVS